MQYVIAGPLEHDNSRPIHVSMQNNGRQQQCTNATHTHATPPVHDKRHMIVTSMKWGSVSGYVSALVQCVARVLL